MTFLNVLAKITGIYNLLLIIIAVFLNPLVLYVCVKSEKLRSHSTFKLLAFNSINDILVCLAWNFECFTNTFFDFLPFFRSIFYCKWISVFVSFTTQCFTSWMLLSISIDRLLSITIKNWHKRYFTGSRPIVYSFLLAFIIAGINLNEIFIGGYVEIINGTEYIDCFSNPPGSYPWYHLMAQILLYFGFIGPFGLLIIVNIAIIYIATKFERSQKDINTKGRTIANRKKSEMTRTILIITFLYIILSLPGTIQTGYVYEDILKLQIDLANFIINILNGLQFSFQAFNFFILYFSNRLFSQEVKRILLNLKSSNQVLRTTGTTGGKSKTNASTHVKLAGQNVNSETADN